MGLVIIEEVLFSRACFFFGNKFEGSDLLVFRKGTSYNFFFCILGRSLGKTGRYSKAGKTAIDEE